MVKGMPLPRHFHMARLLSLPRNIGTNRSGRFREARLDMIASCHLLTDLTHLLHSCSSSIHRRILGGDPRSSHLGGSVLAKQIFALVVQPYPNTALSHRRRLSHVESRRKRTCLNGMQLDCKLAPRAYRSQRRPALVPRFAGGLGMLDEQEVQWPSTQTPASRHRPDTCMCCA